jgi:hypothetical protein
MVKMDESSTEKPILASERFPNDNMINEMYNELRKFDNL